MARPEEFGRAYLAGLREQFLHIQEDYRKRRRAFDTLFKHCKYDPAGSYGYRWECVLRRLDSTDANALVEAVARHVRALQPRQLPSAPAAVPVDYQLSPNS